MHLGVVQAVERHHDLAFQLRVGLPRQHLAQLGAEFKVARTAGGHHPGPLLSDGFTLQPVLYHGVVVGRVVAVEADHRLGPHRQAVGGQHALQEIPGLLVGKPGRRLGQGRAQLGPQGIGQLLVHLHGFRAHVHRDQGQQIYGGVLAALSNQLQKGLVQVGHLLGLHHLGVPDAGVAPGLLAGLHQLFLGAFVLEYLAQPLLLQRL